MLSLDIFLIGIEEDIKLNNKLIDNIDVIVNKLILITLDKPVRLNIIIFKGIFINNIDKIVTILDNNTNNIFSK